MRIEIVDENKVILIKGWLWWRRYAVAVRDARCVLPCGRHHDHWSFSGTSLRLLCSQAVRVSRDVERWRHNERWVSRRPELGLPQARVVWPGE